MFLESLLPKIIYFTHTDFQKTLLVPHFKILQRSGSQLFFVIPCLGNRFFSPEPQMQILLRT